MRIGNVEIEFVKTREFEETIEEFKELWKDFSIKQIFGALIMYLALVVLIICM